MRHLKSLNPSGGFFYHYTAFRFLFSWKDFKKQLWEFLKSWHLYHKNLLLIGPSAGYTLDKSFLKSFKKIHIIEPDPFAYYIFKLRFPGLKCSWDAKDHFGFLSKKYQKGQLQKVLSQFNDYNVLFCNLLGQIPLLIKEEGYLNLWKQDLLESLSHISWASYHDIFSYPTNNPQVITDHLTKELFPHIKNRTYLKWQHVPQRTHIIEVVYENNKNH